MFELRSGMAAYSRAVLATLPLGPRIKGESVSLARPQAGVRLTKSCTSLTKAETCARS
jgi:hypothetical protein